VSTVGGYFNIISSTIPLPLTKKAFTSKRKTDPVDSRQIAEYGYRYFDKLHFWKPKAELIEQIHSVLTIRELLTKQLTAHRNALQALERKVVKTPVAIRMHQKNIRRLVKNIQTLDQAIKEFIDQDPDLKAKATLAQSVPGVGQLLTANLMVITQGFTQYVNPKSLAAYAGICPYEHQILRACTQAPSGSSVNKKPKSDRHGTGRVRKLLHLAARSVATHKVSFRKYFLRKTEQGKPKKLVLNNIANRLLKVICAVVTSNTPYIENYRSVNPALLR